MIVVLLFIALAFIGFTCAIITEKEIFGVLSGLSFVAAVGFFTCLVVFFR